MTEQERLQRRVRLATAQGWKDIQQNANTLTGPDACGTWPDNRPGIWGTHRGYIPNYDTDPAAREGLLEWFLKFSTCHSVQIHTCPLGWKVLVFDGVVVEEATADTYAESLLSAIDAALLAREKP